MILLGDVDENGDDRVGACRFMKLLGDEADNGGVKDDDRWSVKLGVRDEDEANINRRGRFKPREIFSIGLFNVTKNP